MANGSNQGAWTELYVVLWLSSCNAEWADLTLKTVGHDLFRGSLERLSSII